MLVGMKNNEKNYGKTVICKHETPDGHIYIEYVKVDNFNGFYPEDYRGNLVGTLFYKNGISKFGWDNISHEILTQIDSRDWKPDYEKAVRTLRSYIPSIGYNDNIIGHYCNPIRCVDLNVVFPFYSEMCRYIGCPQSSIFTSAFTYGNQKTVEYAGHTFEKAVNILETDVFPYSSMFAREWEVGKIKLPETSHYVYKFVLNDEILYIGKSDRQSFDRIYQHGKPGDNICESAWKDINNSDIYYAPLYNEVMSDVVESELIRRYKPKFNIGKTKTKWCGIELSDVNWIPLRVAAIDEVRELKEENALLTKKLKCKVGEIKNLIDQIDNMQMQLSAMHRMNASVDSFYDLSTLRSNMESKKQYFMRDEIKTFFRYYPLNGIVFYAETIFKGTTTNISQISLESGDIVARRFSNDSGTFKERERVNMSKETNHLMLTFCLTPHYFPNNSSVYGLYVDLLKQKIDQGKRITEAHKRTVRDVITDKWYNNYSIKKPEIEFIDFHYQNFDVDENNFVIDGESVEVRRSDVRDEHDLIKSLYFNTDDFLDQYGDCECELKRPIDFPDEEETLAKIEQMGKENIDIYGDFFHLYRRDIDFDLEEKYEVEYLKGD